MLQLRFVDQDKPPVWLVESHYALGSDSSCNLYLSGGGILPQHAELSVVGEQLTLTPLAHGGTLAVNGLVITHPTPLVHNSRLSLGDVELLVVDPKIELDLKKQKTSTGSAVPLQSEWYLASTTTALADRRFPIKGSTIIGRAAECDISLGVAHLSRKHARLWVEGDQLWVEDLGSSNGTYVNNQPVRRTQLKRGDLLGLDTLVFSVLGGFDGQEYDGEKTSIRPSVGSVPASALSFATPIPTVAARPSEIKIRPPQNSAGQESSETGGGWPLWLGLLFVGFLTAATVFYFMS
jgi:hypothetical protein